MSERSIIHFCVGAVKVALERRDKLTSPDSGGRFPKVQCSHISICVTLFLFSDQSLKNHEPATVITPSLSGTDIWAGLWTCLLFHLRMRLPVLRCSSWLYIIAYIFSNMAGVYFFSFIGTYKQTFSW